MKRNITSILIPLFFSLGLYAQIKTDYISSIDNAVHRVDTNSSLNTYEVTDSTLNLNERIIIKKRENKIVKIEYTVRYDNSNDFTSIKIYLKNKKPILIEKETKETINATLRNPINDTVEINDISNRKYRYYIINWDKDLFNLKHWNSKSNKFEHPMKNQQEIDKAMFKDGKYELIRIINISNQ